ncbi:MAG: HD domain-containing protein [Ruminococcus sp.]|nr:HD domain-containing protein [Ruminococcus sp.]
MIAGYYSAAFWLSVILMLVYAFVYHRHYDVHISLIFVLVPISNLAQLLISQNDDLSSALLANRIMYIGGCYLILMVTLAVFSLCDIKLNRYIRLLLYLITTGVFICTQQIGRNELYYKSVTIVNDNGSFVLVKEYGILHVIYYIMVVAYFMLGIGAIAYSFFRKNQVSNRFIALLALPEVLSYICFFAGRTLLRAFDFFPNAELIPLVYDVALIVYLIITHKLVLYNLPDTVIDTIVQNGDTGFISFDWGFRYLGSNETAKGIFPELSELTVDKTIKTESLKSTLIKWLTDFSRDNTCDNVFYSKGDQTFLINISYLSDGSHKRGYQMFITDDTKDQQYIALLDSFNTELKAEVAQKTEHIVEMHDNLILSMAMMVESRDNSTGGHIRRTSEGVRILIDEMKHGGEFELSERFCSNIIKAAPMHDLGKIAVADSILRKPGRFTEDEFAIMKTHAAEGARIVHEILKGTDDEDFRVLAENVAHYHHERWDGSGYPEGLKGEQIPLEARIMAIADVYDALVSKRFYKESMSFEQADSIIMEGMGKQFDKRLEPYYIAARPRLEEYYSNID